MDVWSPVVSRKIKPADQPLLIHIKMAEADTDSDFEIFAEVDSVIDFDTLHHDKLKFRSRMFMHFLTVLMYSFLFIE